VPNDLPDWTTQVAVNIVGGISKANLGDVGGPILNPDSVTETLGGSNILNPQGSLVLASFKPASTTPIARRLLAGAIVVGTATSVTPAFGQATLAGNLLVAWVTASGGAEPTTGAAGWSKIASFGLGSSLWAAIWAKPNCAGADAAPTFTSAGGVIFMTAQLAEFTGAAVSPVDQTASGSTTTQTFITAAATAPDVGFGDLVVVCSRWTNSVISSFTAVDILNNSALAVQAGAVRVAAAQFAVSTYGVVPAALTAQPLGTAAWDHDVNSVSNVGAGVAASVVLSAVPGKAYHLDRISADMAATTAAADRQLVQVLDGVTLVWQRVMAVQAVIGSIDHIFENGLGLRGTVGNSMTVKFVGAGAGTQEQVSAGAYLR